MTEFTNLMKQRVAIIGTCGRDANKNLLTFNLYEKMKMIVVKQLKSLKTKNVELISGGAAWADHLAVDIFLNQSIPCSLHLFLPTAFDIKNNRYANNSVGNTSNFYHECFSKKMKRNTLLEIGEALRKGATNTVRNGFYARNFDIAQADKLIALSWSCKKSEPSSGGTLHTWNLAKNKNQKYHINLWDLLKSE